jgi:hypothetical protein
MLFTQMIDQVSCPYKTRGKFIIFDILNLRFLDGPWEDKRFKTEWQQAFPEFNLFLSVS